MPVPTDTVQQKSVAHPVIKSIPIWINNSIWGQTPSFPKGLTVADNASVIKGLPAQACIPPMYSLDSHPTTYVSGRVSSQKQVRFDPFYNQHQPHQSYLNDADSLRYSPDDIDPGLDSGPDSGSSPLEPATPFADFVDNAIAAVNPTTLEYHHPAAVVDAPIYSEQEPVSVQHTVFPSIADQANQAQQLSQQYQQEQQQAPPPLTPSPPSATVNYKKLAEPLSEWVATYVWKACTTGFSLPPAFTQPSNNASTPHAVVPPNHLAHAIHSLLLSTLLQPSAVLLAIWYIVRLPVYFDAVPLGPDRVKEATFRATLLGDSNPDASETSAPFRLVVLGCMLANKWLDDHTFSNKTWYSISSIPVQLLNKLEVLTLEIFAHDLSISSQQWSQWLSHVMGYHLSLSSSSHPQPISRPSSNPHSIIRKAIEEITQASVVIAEMKCPQPLFLGMEQRLKERFEKEKFEQDAMEIDLDEDGPLRDEYVPKKRQNLLMRDNQPKELVASAGVGANMTTAQKWYTADPIKSLPPPAKWSPEADEPIARNPNRASGQYVAVQAPPPVPVNDVSSASYVPSYASRPQDVAPTAYSQNWNPLINNYPLQPLKPVGYNLIANEHAAYQFPQQGYRTVMGQVQPSQTVGPPSHMRSQSHCQQVTYEPQGTLPLVPMQEHNYHARSYSQAQPIGRYDYMAYTANCGGGGLGDFMRRPSFVPNNENVDPRRDNGHYDTLTLCALPPHLRSVGMQSAW